MGNKDDKINIEDLVKEAEASLNVGNHQKAQQLLQIAENSYNKLFSFSVRSGNPDPSILFAKQKVLYLTKDIPKILSDLNRIVEYTNQIISQSLKQGSTLALDKRLKERTQAYTELASLHLDPNFSITKDDLSFSKEYMDKAVISARELKEFTQQLSFSYNAIAINILTKVLYMRADLKSSYLNEFDSSLEDINEGINLLEDLVNKEEKNQKNKEQRNPIKKQFPSVEMITYNEKKSPGKQQLTNFRIKKGYVYLYKKQEDKAITEFMKAETPTGSYNAAIGLLGLNKINEAVECFISAIDGSKNMDHIVINSIKELDQIALNSYRNAESVYQNDQRKAIDEVTESITIIDFLSESRVLKNNINLEHLTEQKKDLLNLRGFCYNKIGEYELAIEDFKTMNNYIGKHNIANTYINQAEYEEAINYLTESIEENPARSNEGQAGALLVASCKNLIHSIGKILNQEYEWYSRCGDYNLSSIQRFSKCIGACKTTLNSEEKIGESISNEVKQLLSSTLNSRGIANKSRGRQEYALEDFENSNTPQSLYNAAHIAFEMNQFNKTKQYLDKVILISNQVNDRVMVNQATLFLIDLVRGRYV
ncbi:tetratricopeptide repeat protein [archaeon]|jgi:tetratricopeptide (TPR) repeat protein|nr:tetratricopeptide repeat protein [archaeon]MBT3450345.1 tetratricopeptide repeat protein [archaeon]MBT6868880.1 tetratricopeptide repeat protein [archaeon]MBT7192899.1 tetratricopeptide repeat protein [archaeon]MBT7380865.1 tetratricopeptide repeat protein [archaeon]